MCAGFLWFNFHPSSISDGRGWSTSWASSAAAAGIIVTGKIDFAARRQQTIVSAPLILPLRHLYARPRPNVTSIRRMSRGKSPSLPTASNFHDRLLVAGHLTAGSFRSCGWTAIVCVPAVGLVRVVSPVAVYARMTYVLALAMVVIIVARSGKPRRVPRCSPSSFIGWVADTSRRSPLLAIGLYVPRPGRPRGPQLPRSLRLLCPRPSR